MEDAKYLKFEVSMLVMVVLLVPPHVRTVVHKIRSVWTAIGMVKIHSQSRNRVFHKESCGYVQGVPRRESFLYMAEERNSATERLPSMLHLLARSSTWKKEGTSRRR